ncbi:riboflavin synthase [Xylanimonas oleitrophica]|uniref:Riboflavin synthase n=1 Tax=Xylanimonas oleitrophica TaxID=2607479 RepID=A0A2W5WWU0_9MICO|nr:riboflavin synthase [Xylanimonas oleitrophica]PZR52776.1 riboflavin synthase [Xylanimonas oleitrophica]
MFTGIVEEQGKVRSVVPGPEGRDAVLTVEGPLVTSDTRPGASIAVDGVCLTVTGLTGDGAFTADVMPQTLDLTALGGLGAGDRVNLERAVLAGGRLDGHVVQGHVDGVATLRSRTPGPRWDRLLLTVPQHLGVYLAPQGSVALAGVSLTVAALHDGEQDDGGTALEVALIPATLAATTLGSLRPGDRVNVEVDILAKYVERLLATGGAR